MAIYLGSEKQKLILDGVVCHINIYSETPIINGISLLSADNYLLIDSNGLYITAKEDE